MSVDNSSIDVSTFSAYNTGIGSGPGKGGDSSIGSLRISGGSISVHGAGIGSGYAKEGNSRIASLRISGVNIKVYLFECGAGIGSGYAVDGNSTIGTLTISGGIISASASSGAGIGSGHSAEHHHSDPDRAVERVPQYSDRYFDDEIETMESIRFPDPESGFALCRSISSVINLTIIDGSITASSSQYGAGIGAGATEWDNGSADVGDLTILGGHIIATSASGAAIGGRDPPMGF
jgi:hypothetical protein